MFQMDGYSNASKTITGSIRQLCKHNVLVLLKAVVQICVARKSVTVMQMAEQEVDKSPIAIKTGIVVF